MNFDSFTSDKHYLPEIGFDPFEHINYVLSWYKMMNIEILHFEQIQIRRIKTKNRNKEYTELRDFVSQKFFALDLNKFNYLR